MKKVMIIGDYYNGLSDISDGLSDNYEVYRIAFLPLDEYQELQIPGAWELIDFSDFHELTIRTMEFEPDVVLYLSPYLRISRSEQNHELAYMANSEFIEHLKETLGIHNTHLIIIYPKITDHLALKAPILLRTIEEGKKVIDGMAKHTIIHIPTLLDSSEEGFLSWMRGIDINLDETKREAITAGELKDTILEIIIDKKFGEIVLEGKTISEIAAVKIETPAFTGNHENFK